MLHAFDRNEFIAYAYAQSLHIHCGQYVLSCCILTARNAYACFRHLTAMNMLMLMRLLAFACLSTESTGVWAYIHSCPGLQVSLQPSGAVHCKLSTCPLHYSAVQCVFHLFLMLRHLHLHLHLQMQMNMLRQTAGSSGSSQLSQVMDYAMEDGGGGIYPTHKGLYNGSCTMM